MTPREIIAQAWAITNKEPSLRRWAFASATFETLFSLKLLIYQLYFVYKFFTEGEGAGFFDIEIILYNSIAHWVFWTIVIIFFVLLAIELLLPHMCTGAIIGLAAKSQEGQEVRGGFVLGLFNFFPIFGMHEFLSLASVSVVITMTSVIARYVEGDLKWWCLTMLYVLFLLSNLLKFAFSFANEAVVIERKNVFSAMGKSFKLIISHLPHVMFLLLLLFVISLRIVLNIAMVLLIPGIVIGIGWILTFVLSPAVSYSIAGILGIGLIIGASYFFAYLHAFKHTVWTITYLELIKRKELDHIL